MSNRFFDMIECVAPLSSKAVAFVAPAILLPIFNKIYGNFDSGLPAGKQCRVGENLVLPPVRSFVGIRGSNSFVVVVGLNVIPLVPSHWVGLLLG